MNNAYEKKLFMDFKRILQHNKYVFQFHVSTNLWRFCLFLEIYSPSSLPCDSNKQGWGRLKSEAKNSMPEWQGPKDVTVFRCSCRHNSKELDQK